ncbi:MAG: GNAT family N-acetyltransferase [Desulfatibacillum sp.]|nr:GNAT family N-acetyltransferase [Desulfatibacillum sp.]
MTRISLVNDQDLVARLWATHMPEPGNVFDLWETRMCFDRSFRRPVLAVVASDGLGQTTGFLPLSWVEETAKWVYFPGETWKGKTWLEGNLIPARDPETMEALLEAIPGDAYLRYLDPMAQAFPYPGADQDEVGYLFFPERYSNNYQEYLQSFPRKTIKKLLGEMARLESRGVTYRFDSMEDAQRLLQMNLEAFGPESYFFDSRFSTGFENLLAWLKQNNLLRITTVLIEGRVAAVDVGALWRGHYSILAGGVDQEFPGVAKVINFHHLERACAEKLNCVDFLCGNFNWKERLRLIPRPLMEIRLEEQPGMVYSPVKEEEHAVSV